MWYAGKCAPEFSWDTEFLWQEGHTVHASEAEASETHKMLEVYREFLEEVMAIPVIVGEKSPGERFPGAVSTFTLEAMMQDRKALQAGTSHYLGQNFSKGSEIKFSDQEGKTQYAYTTSWGMSTRVIGALIMTHSDDDGLTFAPVSPISRSSLFPSFPNLKCRTKYSTPATPLQLNCVNALSLEKISAYSSTKGTGAGERKIGNGSKKGSP